MGEGKPSPFNLLIIMRINFKLNSEKLHTLSLSFAQLLESFVHLSTLGIVQLTIYDRLLFSKWIQGGD